jgi:phosphate transport system substrate-binding protein
MFCNFSRRVLLATCGVTLLISGCGGGGGSSAPKGPLVLKGAGATAPYLAYSKWIAEYTKHDPSVALEYEQTGSSEGIRRLESGTVDFAASDIPLTDGQIENMKVKPFHFPTLVSAIAVVSNVPGISQDLRFTGDALAGIFSGRIKNWNDPALRKANPGVSLPGNPIAVIHRADDSGTTYAFTDYLSQVSEAWKSGPGRGATVKWSTGQEARGSEGIAELVKKTPYSISYLDLNYALQQQLAVGSVQNASGQFQKPTLEAVGAGAAPAEGAPRDFRMSIVNSAGANAYPICTLTWLIVPSEIPDQAKQRAMKRFLRWAYDSGIKLVLPMDYGMLPTEQLNRVRDQIERIH